MLNDYLNLKPIHVYEDPKFEGVSSNNANANYLVRIQTIGGDPREIRRSVYEEYHPKGEIQAYGRAEDFYFKTKKEAYDFFCKEAGYALSMDGTEGEVENSLWASFYDQEWVCVQLFKWADFYQDPVINLEELSDENMAEVKAEVKRQLERDKTPIKTPTSEEDLPF